MSRLLIPDTNFLIYLVKYRLLNELEHYKIVLVPQIIEELKKLERDKKTKIEDRTAAVVAGMFLRNFNMIVHEVKGKADDAIIAVAKKFGAKIGTMDKELSKKAMKEGLEIIKIRQKKYLK